MDVLLDALGYQVRQPHQEDVSTSSTDAHKELLARVCCDLGVERRRREIAMEKVSKQRAFIRRGCDGWSSRPGLTGAQPETSREQQCGF
jgi:hypothetical protein